MISFIISSLLITLGIAGFYFLLRNRKTYFTVTCYYISAVLLYISVYFISETYNFQWYSLPLMMILATGIVYSMLIDNYAGVVFGPALTMIFTLLGKLIYQDIGAIAGLAAGYVILLIIKRFSSSAKKVKSEISGEKNDESRDL